MEKLESVYESAWQYMKRSGRDILELDDRVYENLVSSVYDKVKENNLYNDDIIFSCIDKFLKEDYSRESLAVGRADRLITDIETAFEKNKKTHYLLIPFNGGRLEKDINFENFYFIIGSEEEKLNKIINFTGYDNEKIKQFIEHTKSSRSKDFMTYPLLVLRIDDVNKNVCNNATLISRRIFMLLKLMIFCFEIPHGLWAGCINQHEDNYHVAIIGDEEWQYSHKNWWNLINFKYALDFMEESNYQELFIKVMNSFGYRRDRDKLKMKFLNALELFEKSLEQEENYRDTTLSYMLLFAAAESLLTEDKNEKKLRLSVIWPRIVNIPGKTTKELGQLIKKTYDLRNDFVHAGRLAFSDESEDLRILHKMLAKLIMKYFEDGTWEEREKNLEAWKRYVDGIFENVIYG